MQTTYQTIQRCLKEDSIKKSLSINQHNIKPHLDIERDIQAKKNGLMTFNLRVNQGNIEDYAKYTTVTIGEYAGVIFTAFEEHTTTYDSGNGSNQNAIRPNNR